LPQGKASRVLDLGTGSGAIALSIAHFRPDAVVVAVDASEAALEVARENAQRLGIANIRFLLSDWFSALDRQRFDLIVSNPPYVAAGDVHLTQGDVRFEPLSALTSGAEGLDDIRSIVSRAEAYLEHGAWLLLEHGYDQAARVRDIFQQNIFESIFSEKDIAGIDRVSGGVKLR
jgi:release factor glutamine methyltransferase